MNRPNDETNKHSEWMNRALLLVGERYRDAFAGDHAAFRDMVLLAYRVVEALAKLEALHPALAAHEAKAVPGWPVVARTGNGEAERLKERMKRLGVGQVRSDNRKEGGEWPDENLPVNKAAKEVRRIVRRIWKLDTLDAQRIGPIGKINARQWFSLAWPIFLEENGASLPENKYLNFHHKGVLDAELGSGGGKCESPKNNTLGLAGLLRDEVAMREAAKRETDKQRREREQAARVKSASAKASKRLRGEVLRAFEKWYVVEVVT